MAPDYGQRIRRRRQQLGMTQKELGERVGKSESAVISWEKYRHAPTQTQGAIEAVLGISLDGDPPSVDPVEEELRELLGRLQDMNILSEAEAQAKLDGYRERRHRTRNGSIASRAS